MSDQFKIMISTAQIQQILLEHTPTERAQILQVIAVSCLQEKTQMCGWCFTGYATPEEATACARRCGPASQAEAPAQNPENARPIHNLPEWRGREN